MQPLHLTDLHKPCLRVGLVMERRPQRWDRVCLKELKRHWGIRLEGIYLGKNQVQFLSKQYHIAGCHPYKPATVHESRLEYVSTVLRLLGTPISLNLDWGDISDYYKRRFYEQSTGETRAGTRRSDLEEQSRRSVKRQRKARKVRPRKR